MPLQHKLQRRHWGQQGLNAPQERLAPRPLKKHGLRMPRAPAQ